MEQTVEEAASAYLQKILESTDFEVNSEEDNYDAGSRDAVLDVTERAFIASAEWQAKQSPWISVKERLPEENKEYLVVLDNRVVYVAQYNKNNKSWLIYGTGYTYNVVAYMPIPSFDEILETNKDVLQRLKEK